MTNLSKELCEVCNFSTLLYNPKNETLTRVYPDFKKDKNFVKLWKIVNKQTKTEFLQRLINRLRFEAGWYTDDIKQAIRDEEWIYE